MMLKALAVFAATLGGWPTGAALPTGEEIAREADRRQQSRSQFYEGRIRVVDAKGRVRDKAWRFWRIGYGGDSKSVIQFTLPSEVKGVGLLTYSQRGKEDEQWMWTPSIRRDRRIAPQEKSTRFLGTDFTYEDLSERVVEDWDHLLKGETSCEGGTCWIVEAVPHEGKKSQYSRSVAHVRQSDYALMKMDLHVGSALRRTLVLSDHRVLQGTLTAHRLVMSDLEKGSRTELTLTDVRYNLPGDSEFFTLRSLGELHDPPK